MRHTMNNLLHSARPATSWVWGALAASALIGVWLGMGLGAAQAQSAINPSAKPKILRTVESRAQLYTSGAGPYYIEFRSRYAWDYGHTYIVFGRVGEAPGHNSVAGLSPVGDDPTSWVVGHYVPVPAETGWTDGDLEDKYTTARYRVLMSKPQFDHVIAYVRDLQSRSHVWSAELYNCNAFVGDIAKEMGLQVPSSTLIYPKIFVNHMRMMNTGHPDAESTLVSDNVKEMSNPTRDGRAMIVSGVHTIRPDGTPVTETAAAATTPAPAASPNVTIGAVHLTKRAANSAATPSQ